MKKTEVITIISALLVVAGIVTYLKVTSRLAKAEREVVELRNLIDYMRQQDSQRTQQPTPIWQPHKPVEPPQSTYAPPKLEVSRDALVPRERLKHLFPVEAPKSHYESPLLEVPRGALVPPVRLEHLLTDTRPTNGTLLLNRFCEQTIHKGHGELTITNGLTEDAFVKVVEGSKLMAAFYVRGNSSFSINDIPDGSYAILYRTGYGWLEHQRDFERGKGAAKFDNNLVYTTRIQKEGNLIRTYYDTITLTLHKVVDGNAPAEDISDDEFNKFQ
jgi:hypothetical protein